MPVTAIPIEHADGSLLGVFCLRRAGAHPADSARRLKPLLECVRRELAASQPESQRINDLTERSAELEWLFKLTSSLKGATDDRKDMPWLGHREPAPTASMRPRMYPVANSRPSVS